ncbi:MAG: hypothetical protein M3497_03670 [Gemmatimonadota bacterium]|nr:hypothetical protein [Gemmatimonadota bacterium]
MGVVDEAVRLAEPWASLYNDSPPLQTAVLFVHLAGLVVGGGFALATDRATLRVARAGPQERVRHLSELHAVHGAVLIGLTLTFASGVLMFAADLETFASSVVFWVKMGLVLLLLANGYALTRADTALRRDPNGGWDRLRMVSIASSVLWFSLVLAGTWLSNIS